MKPPIIHRREVSILELEHFARKGSEPYDSYGSTYVAVGVVRQWHIHTINHHFCHQGN
jgi:hypothetical protein